MAILALSPMTGCLAQKASSESIGGASLYLTYIPLGLLYHFSAATQIGKPRNGAKRRQPSVTHLEVRPIQREQARRRNQPWLWLSGPSVDLFITCAPPITGGRPSGTLTAGRHPLLKGGGGRQPCQGAVKGRDNPRPRLYKEP